MAAYLNPSALLIFFGSLGIAYGVGRLLKAYFDRRDANKPKPPLTRAERRRALRGRK